MLFLIAEGVPLPSALDIARKLSDDRFDVDRLVEDFKAFVSPIGFSAL